MGSESCGSPQPWALSEAEDSDAGPPGPGPRQPRPGLRVGPLGLIGGGGVVASARPLPPSAGRDGAFAWSRLGLGARPNRPWRTRGERPQWPRRGKVPGPGRERDRGVGSSALQVLHLAPAGRQMPRPPLQGRGAKGPSSESPSSVAPPGNGRSVYAPWCMLLVSDYLWVTVHSLQLATAVSGYQVLRRRSGPLETPP